MTLYRLSPRRRVQRLLTRRWKEKHQREYRWQNIVRLYRNVIDKRQLVCQAILFILSISGKRTLKVVTIQVAQNNIVTNNSKDLYMT